MNTKWEIRVAVILMVILVSIALGGCSVPQIKESVIEHQDTPEHQDSQSTIPDFKGIAEALGCVFAPETCNK